MLIVMQQHDSSELGQEQRSLGELWMIKKLVWNRFTGYEGEHPRLAESFTRTGRRSKLCETLKGHYYTDTLYLSCISLPPAQMLEGSTARISMQDLLRI